VIKFFTDKTVENDYLLIKIGDYLRNGLNWTRWKEIFIDPGVYELKKRPYYSWEKNINIKDFLNSLHENHYFSADYPCDMNPSFTDEFLRKSWENAIQYCGHPNYIVTVQSKFNDYYDFMQWFDKYNDLYIASGILGIGNLCRCINKKYDEFVKHVLAYAFRKCKHPRIHIYGLPFKYIKLASRYESTKMLNIELSIDSTKWTRACSTRLRNKHYPHFNCNNNNRQEFFNEYLDKLREKKIALQNDYVDGGAEQ